MVDLLIMSSPSNPPLWLIVIDSSPMQCQTSCNPRLGTQCGGSKKDATVREEILEKSDAVRVPMHYRNSCASQGSVGCLHKSCDTIPEYRVLDSSMISVSSQGANRAAAEKKYIAARPRRRSD
ncbi:hypothetical protein DL546_003214 [Coniochaeta pulveracea]|uniref:Uncharacterized protein n=1 Tax=Coniochaeta pulveracea TaxID=177199 RepID=A0A420XZU1_9PEZI|nr:hypothetical protein DL546_003214 [Coniochaeta pulveracea]